MGLVSEPLLLRTRRARTLQYLTRMDLQFSAVLSEIVRYSFRNVDPICAALFLWACDACGGDSESALPIAISIECFYRFAILHDDLGSNFDGPSSGTVAAIWGVAQALNAGDAFHAVALRLLATDTKHPDRALQAGAMLTETVLSWLEHRSRVQSPRSAIRTVHASTEVFFFGAALRAGGILAGADATLAATLSRAGRFLAVAKQAASHENDSGGLARKYADKAVAIIGNSVLAAPHVRDFKEIAYHLATAHPA